MLVAAGAHGLRRVVQNSEPLRDHSRHGGRPVAERNDSVHIGNLGEPRRGAFGIFETQRDGVIAPGICEDMAAVRSEHNLVLEALARVHEHLGLVAGGGGHDQNAFHRSVV